MSILMNGAGIICAMIFSKLLLDISVKAYVFGLLLAISAILMSCRDR